MVPRFVTSTAIFCRPQTHPTWVGRQVRPGSNSSLPLAKPLQEMKFPQLLSAAKGSGPEAEPWRPPVQPRDLIGKESTKANIFNICIVEFYIFNLLNSPSGMAPTKAMMTRQNHGA